MVGRAGTSCSASSCQSRFDDIYNRGEQIDHVLRTNTDEAVAKKAPLVEIIPGNGSGQLKEARPSLPQPQGHQASLPPRRELSITGDGNFEGRPNDGDVLMPRVGFHDIEVQWRWLSNQNDTATYAILAADGRQIGIYKAHLRVTGGDGVPS
jgi:hypothetical protein